MLGVALFFFSCEDEKSILGFKNPNKKFDVNYVELPLESTVFLLDSLRTTNGAVAGEATRFLVGRYQDPQFGNVAAEFYTRFFTTNRAQNVLKATATLDSVVVRLRFDFYNYGSKDAAIDQQISVYELNEKLLVDSIDYYFNRSTRAYDPTPLGTTSFRINPATFKTFVDTGKDTAIFVSVKLDSRYANRLFESAVKWRDASTTQDSTFSIPSKFFEAFRGIAVRSDAGDKIIGFNPERSLVNIHFKNTVEEDSLTLSLSMAVGFGGFGFSRITADRSASPLAALTNYTDTLSNLDDRYIQAGTGVMTRINMSKFFQFADQDSNRNMIINEAALVITSSESSATFDPIPSFSLRILDDKKFKLIPLTTESNYAAEVRNLNLYRGTVVPALGLSNGTYTLAGTTESFVTMRRNNDDNSYSGFITLYAQQLFNKEENKERFRYLALMPNPNINKNVNRTVFNKNNLKLRIYYTRPSQP